MNPGATPPETERSRSGFSVSQLGDRREKDPIQRGKARTRTAFL